MTTCIDDVRIKHEVTEYYRYGMFSHEWEDNESLFEQVIHMVVYELEESPTHDKLKMFCKIVQDAGLQWAWSDTCCINKADHLVLEEALVAMSKWYHGSALTVVFLFDFLSIAAWRPDEEHLERPGLDISGISRIEGGPVLHQGLEVVHEPRHS